MDTNQYGEYMKCCISTCYENIEFYIAECIGVEGDGTDKILLDEAFSDTFGNVEEFCDFVHHIQLDINETTITASVDGIQVWDADYAKGRELGNVGLWTTRGVYYAYYDNIIITDGEGKVICKETFDNKKEYIFSPCYVKLIDSWCEASSGFILTQGMEEPAVKAVGTFSPVSISVSVEGEYVYDFGQNFNGNCQITLRNTEDKKGQIVTIRYAEALNSEKLFGCDDQIGTIFTENLYTASNTDYYAIAGNRRLPMRRRTMRMSTII